MDNKDLSRALSSDSFSSLVVGNQIFAAPLTASGKLFVFRPKQIHLLVALQKMRNLEASCLAVDMDLETANKFLTSRKFVAFRNLKLDEAKAKAGLSIDYLLLYSKWTLEGKKTWWDATCTHCGLKDEWTEYQVESCRADDMTLAPECVICFKPVALIYQKQKFEPTREQNEQWKECAARLWPKVERIHHQFTSEEIVFESTGENNNG